MTRIIAALAISCVILTSARGGIASDLPPDSVPGAINPDVTEGNLKSTVCVPNWTSTVRPPVSYTNKLKAQQLKDLGLSGVPRDWEEDHRVPLACGGNPTSPQNLYPQSWTGPYGAHVKDVLEAYEHRAVCRGSITLAQCQAVFMGDWRVEYDKLFGSRGPH